AAARNPDRRPMLRHVQIEANLTITGGAADERIALAPSGELAALAEIVRTLVPGADARAAALAGAALAALPAGLPERLPAHGEARRRIDAAANGLRAAGARGLVLCGSDDPAAQLLAALANALLDNGRTTAVVDAAAASRAGELGFDELAHELAAGTVGALFFVGTNPALVDARLGAALPRVPFTLSTSDRLDETAAATRAHAPEGHFLEAWRDARPRPGVDVMGQPCVTPLHDTRGRTASLLAWAGEK